MKTSLLAIFILTIAAAGLKGQAIDSLKSLLISSNSDTSTVRLLLELSQEFENVNIDSAQLYGEKSLALSEEIADAISIAKSKQQLAWVESFLGNFDRSIELVLESKEIADSAGDKYLMSHILNSMGELYNRQNSVEEALRYFKQALDLQREIGDSLTEVYTLSNLSILFGKGGDLGASLDHIQEAFELANALDDDKLISLTSANLSIVYMYSGRYDKSREYSQISLDYAIKLGNERNAAYALNNIGKSYQSEGNTSKALEYFKKSLAIHRDLRDPEAIASALSSIGDFFTFLREYDSASAYFNEALQVAYSSGNLVTKSKVHSALYRLDTLQGNYSAALKHINAYVQVNDSLRLSENKEAIQKLKVSYDTERKDDKIELLKRQNEIEVVKSERQSNLKTAFIIGSVLLALLCLLIYSRFRIKKRSLVIIEKQKAAIEEKNNENELLMKETHHRVKNNLQLILSLLSSQRNILVEDDKALDILQESQNRIKSISLLHESLYDTDNFSSVRTTEYFKEIVTNIETSFVDESKNIGVQTDIEDTVIDSSLAVTLGLIINELVTNSLKYAFHNKNEGSLEIKFKKSDSDSMVNLAVSDDGCGLPPDFDIEKSESFGLQMVRGLVNQLNGIMVLKTDNGTGFDISVNNTKIT